MHTLKYGLCYTVRTAELLREGLYMKCFKLKTVLVVIGLLFISLIFSSAEANQYDQDISGTIPISSAQIATLFLDNESVHITVDAWGEIDIYFMSATNYSNADFEKYQNISYYPALSSLKTKSMDKSAKVPHEGIWYLVMFNHENILDTPFTGHVTALNPVISDPPTDTLIIEQPVSNAPVNDANGDENSVPGTATPNNRIFYIVLIFGLVAMILIRAVYLATTYESKRSQPPENEQQEDSIDRIYRR